MLTLWKRKTHLLTCVCFFFGALFFLGCEEERFNVPQNKRANDQQYKSRMLAAPLASKHAKQQSKKPSLPKKLRIARSIEYTGTLDAFALSPSGLFALGGGSHQNLVSWTLPKLKTKNFWPSAQGPIRTIRISASGRKIATLEGQNTLSLWTLTGKRVKQVSLPAYITTIYFAPISNQILALTKTGTLLYLNGRTLQIIRKQIVCPNQKSALSLDVDTLQRWITVGCESGHIWLSPFGKRGTWVQMKTAIHTVALSPKEAIVAVGTQDARVALWGWTSQGLQKIQEQTGHARSVTRLAFNPDGETLLSGSQDRHIGIWHWKKKKLKLVRRLRHTESICGLAWLPESNQLFIAADRNGTLRTWRTDGTRLAVSSPATPQRGLVSFNKRKPWLITQGDRGFAVWDLKTGQRTLASIAHPHSLITLQSTIDGNHLLAVDRDNVVFWDLHRRKYIDIVYPPKGSHITAATLGRSWTEVWFAATGKGVFLWTIAGKRLLYRHTTPQHVTSVAYHSRTQRAVAATLHGELYIYDMQARRWLTTQRLSLKYGPISHVSFSPTGAEVLVVQGEHAFLYPWMKKKVRMQIQVKTPITASHFTADGATLLLGGQDHRLMRWDLKKNQLKPSITVCTSPVQSIDQIKRLPYIAVACQDGTTHLWDKRQIKHISTHIPLAEKEWLSYTPSLYFSASRHAFREFSFRTSNKSMSLHSFKDWFFSPQKLQKGLLPVR